MSSNRKSDERYLDKDERDLVDEARHPGMTALDSEQLRNLARRLRERRDRAQGLDRKQVRSARGKDAPPVKDGNRQKSALLSAAIARVNKEYARRSDV